MATVILVRHGRTTANATGLLAGRQRGVRLDEVGREQAARAGARLAAVHLAAVVTSPLERCRETAAAIVEGQPAGARALTDKALIECDYGDWQGRSLKELSREKLWTTVQRQPSAVTFPGGETLVNVAARAVAAVRSRDAAIEAEHGPGAVWAAVSHGDVIKAVVGEALGQHLDLFQRISADPASITIIRYTAERPYVLALNTHDGDLAWLNPPRKGRTTRARRADAAVGGGSGPAAAGEQS